MKKNKTLRRVVDTAMAQAMVKVKVLVVLAIVMMKALVIMAMVKAIQVLQGPVVDLITKF